MSFNINTTLPEVFLFLEEGKAVSSFLFLTIPGLFDLGVTTGRIDGNGIIITSQIIASSGRSRGGARVSRPPINPYGRKFFGPPSTFII